MRNLLENYILRLIDYSEGFIKIKVKEIFSCSHQNLLKTKNTNKKLYKNKRQQQQQQK